MNKRTKKKNIPIGDYCYRITKISEDKCTIFTKRCPFYRHVENLEGKCKLFNYEITDSCKECNINIPIEDDYCCEYHSGVKK